jgi:hypothetical protein
MKTAVEWLYEQFLEGRHHTDKEYEEIFNKALEMEQKQDSKRLLFVYKVSLIIGLEKTGELLKEVEKEIKQEQ